MRAVSTLLSVVVVLCSKDEEFDAPWLLCRGCGSEVVSRDAFLPQPAGSDGSDGGSGGGGSVAVEARPEPWLDGAAGAGAGRLQRFINPQQVHFDVAAFRQASGVRTAGGTADSGGGGGGGGGGAIGGSGRESFYPGYSWKPITCSRCGAHLGWKFVSEEAAKCEAGGGSWETTTTPDDAAHTAAGGASAAEREAAAAAAAATAATAESGAMPHPATEQELLGSYAGRCMVLDRGWWQYSWCHGAEVKQQHVDPQTKKVGDSWSLGRYSAARSAEANNAAAVVAAAAAAAAAVAAGGEAEASGGGGVYRLVYEGGQPCDETGGKGRSTTVVHRCCAGDSSPAPASAGGAATGQQQEQQQQQQQQGTYIREIKEPSTCQYELEVCVQELCGENAPPQYTPRYPPCCGRAYPKTLLTPEQRNKACARHCKEDQPRTAEEAAASASACKAAAASAAAGRAPAFYGLLWSKVVAEDSDDLAWAEGIQPITALHR
jgi:hypothetical protein